MSFENHILYEDRPLYECTGDEHFVGLLPRVKAFEERHRLNMTAQAHRDLVDLITSIQEQEKQL